MITAKTIGWTITDWRTAYRHGARPDDLLPELLTSLPADDPAWISRVGATMLHDQLQALATKRRHAGDSFTQLPLYGVPFAVKDNIDVAGLATTAACPAFAYRPVSTATTVQRLIDAGAVVIGKTNLDQFATGLVGVRSPYGAVPNAFDARYISGGSSSGSASVVARGLVPFALGTDTAGSGRVPAGLNNIVGLKPTRGALSAAGVVPACKTLDCVTIFALTVVDAQTVYDAAAGFDAADAYSRRAPVATAVSLSDHPRFGVPQSPEWFGDGAAAECYERALAQIVQVGGVTVSFDFTPLHDVTALLYDGPWVAERYAAIASFVERHADEMHPVTRQIITGAKRFSAADTFNAMYRLAELRAAAERIIDSVDALLVPTAPTIYPIDAVEADPIRLNSRLGTYTNFVNLLDWCAVAVPAGFRNDGLPFGITFIAPAWRERALIEFAGRWQEHLRLPLGASNRQLTTHTIDAEPNAQTLPSAGTVRLAVVGAHLRGMPLNNELTARGARFVECTHTSRSYRLYALSDVVPPKPGLARTGSGAAIEVELWDMPLERFGDFVAGIPAPLGIGTVELVDGRWVKGFICEAHALTAARDITEYGGWRTFLTAGRN